MDEIKNLLAEFRKRIESLEKKLSIKNLTFPTDGKIVIPVMTADPASPVNGQMWVNSTSGTFKIRIGGVTKTVTIT